MSAKIAADRASVILMILAVILTGAAWLSHDEDEPQRTVDRAPAVLVQPVAATH